MRTIADVLHVLVSMQITAYQYLLLFVSNLYLSLKKFLFGKNLKQFYNFSIN